MVFITWSLASCAKPELILWLWEKIRKSWYACLHTVMFCHGWQNKAASSHGWLVVAGHVTPRKSNSDTLRLFLFSYNGTKINSGFAQDATHKPATHHLDGRHISPTNHHLANQLFNTPKSGCNNNPLLQPLILFILPTQQSSSKTCCQKLLTPQQLMSPRTFPRSVSESVLLYQSWSDVQYRGILHPQPCGLALQ